MHIVELWRYPVKSLAGESLKAVELTPDGVIGDRVVHVRDARGWSLRGRSHGCSASTVRGMRRGANR
jgi:hypothetical protein